MPGSSIQALRWAGRSGRALAHAAAALGAILGAILMPCCGICRARAVPRKMRASGARCEAWGQPQAVRYVPIAFSRSLDSVVCCCGCARGTDKITLCGAGEYVLVQGGPVLVQLPVLVQRSAIPVHECTSTGAALYWYRLYTNTAAPVLVERPVLVQPAVSIQLSIPVQLCSTSIES